MLPVVRAKQCDRVGVVVVVQEMAMLLERGSLCRTTGSTLMNAHSSRSHAIFTVLLEQRIRPEGEAPVADERVSRLLHKG